MKTILSIFLIFSFLFISCKKKVSIDQIQLTEDIIYHPELGWKMKLPKNWKNISSKDFETKREKLQNQFPDISTDLIIYEELGITLAKNQYNTFNSIYFINKDNSYSKITFQQEKLEKYRILENYFSNSKIDSTLTNSVKIGNKQFDYYTFTVKSDYETPLKTITFTGKMKDYQVLITVKTDDDISESEILNSFYNSTFE